MTIMAPHYVDESAIESAVRAVERSFAPDVVRINYSFEEDWTGHPSIYFRILVRDEAAPIDRLGVLALDIPFKLMNEAKTFENGLHAYFSYRSVSEQQQLRDPIWD